MRVLMDYQRSGIFLTSVHVYVLQVYVFNRYGQHLSTVDLLTGVQLYNFTYNVHSYFGRLLKVTDAGGQQMTIRRDYKLVARDIWVRCLYSFTYCLVQDSSGWLTVADGIYLGHYHITGNKVRF